MKTAIVTVSEFLHHGGELKFGRKIYDRLGTELGTYYGLDRIGCVLTNESNKSIGQVVAHVEIKCTPIYK